LLMTDLFLPWTPGQAQRSQVSGCLEISPEVSPHSLRFSEIEDPTHDDEHSRPELGTYSTQVRLLSMRKGEAEVYAKAAERKPIEDPDPSEGTCRALRHNQPGNDPECR